MNILAAVALALIGAVLLIIGVIDLAGHAIVIGLVLALIGVACLYAASRVHGPRARL